MEGQSTSFILYKIELQGLPNLAVDAFGRSETVPLKSFPPGCSSRSSPSTIWAGGTGTTIVKVAPSAAKRGCFTACHERGKHSEAQAPNRYQALMARAAVPASRKGGLRAWLKGVALAKPFETPPPVAEPRDAPVRQEEAPRRAKHVGTTSDCWLRIGRLALVTNRNIHRMSI